MTINRIAAGVALAIVLADAAFAESFRTEFDTTANFAAYKTFTWIKEPEMRDPLIRDRVVSAVDAALRARGFQVVTSGAGLAIAVHAATGPEQTLETFYNGFEGGWRWDGRLASEARAISVYETGALVVDIFDATTKNVIWRGTSDNVLAKTGQKNTRHLNKTVAQMFEQFPPAQKTKVGVFGWVMAVLAAGLSMGGR